MHLFNPEDKLLVIICNDSKEYHVTRYLKTIGNSIFWTSVYLMLHI